MLGGDQPCDRGNLRLAQMLAGTHERLERHPAVGLTVARYRVGEPQRRPFAIREQRAGLVAGECVQRVDRKVCLTPEMPAAFDAPPAATALGGALRDEHAQSRIEIGTARVIARERGIRGQDPRTAGRNGAGGNQCAPKPSHKCTHSVIQLYHAYMPPSKPSEGLSPQNYRFRLHLAILLDPNNR